MANTTNKQPHPRGDRALWQEVISNIKPLRSRGATLRAEPTPIPAPQASPGRQTNEPRPSLDRLAGIDRANAERLKRGQRQIEARLDLHGMTQAEAHRELAIFVAASHDAGRRCVLIITGRGLGPSGPGVLKSSVPRWLEEPELRRRVLAIAPAQPQHGGGGAAYLLLRRNRRSP